MGVPYQHARGTKSALDTLAAASGLKVGQVYFLTDEQRLVVAHAVNAYTALAKQSEVGEGGGSSGGPMATFINQPTGTVSVTTTAEVELASVSIPAGAAGRKLLILANSNFTKDTGTTVRATTMRLRQGTDNSGTLLKSASSAAANVASIPFGTATIAFLHEPGAGATNYRISAVNFASSTITANNISIQVIDLTSASAATVADIQALTGAGAISPANLAAAANFDTVTGINEFNPLWNEFISAYVESDVSSVTFEFNNPVSVIPGTSRVVYLAVAAGATSRVVAWGSDYIDPPAITVPGSGYKVYRIVMEATPFPNVAETSLLIHVSATELAVTV